MTVLEEPSEEEGGGEGVGCCGGEEGVLRGGFVGSRGEG